MVRSFIKLNYLVKFFRLQKFLIGIGFKKYIHFQSWKWIYYQGNLI